MSLQIWFPLNGHTRNQGLLPDLTFSNAQYTSSPFGKSLTRGSAIMSADQAASILNNKAISILFWIYVNAETGSKDKIGPIFGNNNVSSTTDNRKFSVFQYPTCNDLHISWMNTEVNKAFAYKICSGVLPSYGWAHVAITYENPKVSIYINGALKDTLTGISNSPSFAYITNVINDSPYRTLADFRIYDNCISAREVRDIYNVLLVHYPLNQPDMARNLLPISFMNMTSSAYGFATTSCTLTAGKRYTLFANGRVIDGDGSLNVYIYNSAWNDCTNKETKSKTDVTLVIPFTPKNTDTYKVTTYSFLSQSTHGGNVHINWYKLVEGDFTDMTWSPNSSDTYSWGNVIYDTSGFGNNATLTSAVSASQDAPRYNMSMVLASSGSRPQIASVFTAGQAIYAFTVSGWFKTDTMNSTIPNLFSLDGNNFIRARLGSTNSIWCYMIVASKASYDTYNAGKTLTDNQWHFYAIRFNGGKIDVFIDDKKIGSSDFTSNGTFLIDGGGNGWYLGGYQETSECFSGSLSDFRIYSTALPDDDIMRLYNAPVSITNTGTLITQGELKEE